MGGFLCTNELDIGLAFTDCMMALFKAKVGRGGTAYARLLLGGAPYGRFSGAEAKRVGLTDEVVTIGKEKADETPAKVLEMARKIAKKNAAHGDNKAVYRQVKELMYS